MTKKKKRCVKPSGQKRVQGKKEVKKRECEGRIWDEEAAGFVTGGRMSKKPTHLDDYGQKVIQGGKVKKRGEIGRGGAVFSCSKRKKTRTHPECAK